MGLLSEKKECFKNVNYQTMSTIEALFRVSELKLLSGNALMADTTEQRIKDLREFATMALSGVIGELTPQAGETIEIDHIDLDSSLSDEEELKSRSQKLYEKSKNIILLNDFYELALYALTGIPF